MNHKFYEQNEAGKDFVVGDLHGHIELLRKALETIEFNKDTDRMFSVGDLIDRGPDSLECLKLINEDWFHPVIGNHEQFLINSVLKGQSPNNWFANGGDWVPLLENEEMDEVVILARALREKVPYAITVQTSVGKMGICHAQPPSADWVDVYAPTGEQRHLMTWGRDWAQSDITVHVKNIFQTFHGHTPIEEAAMVGNVMFIDTGAFYTGNLTVIRIQ